MFWWLYETTCYQIHQHYIKAGSKAISVCFLYKKVLHITTVSKNCATNPLMYKHFLFFHLRTCVDMLTTKWRLDIWGFGSLKDTKGRFHCPLTSADMYNHLCIVCRPGETFVHWSARCHPQGKNHHTKPFTSLSYFYLDLARKVHFIRSSLWFKLQMGRKQEPCSELFYLLYKEYVSWSSEECIKTYILIPNFCFKKIKPSQRNWLLM
jgi:hypothetical protein